MTRLFLSLSLLLSLSAFAHESEPSPSLFFDKPIAKEFAAQFEIEEDLHPEQSPFRVVDFAFMSNEQGERWAMVNVLNTASAPRSIVVNHIYGLFADGSYRKPKTLAQRIDGGTTQTVLIPFGVSKTPLVKLIAREL